MFDRVQGMERVEGKRQGIPRGGEDLCVRNNQGVGYCCGDADRAQRGRRTSHSYQHVDSTSHVAAQMSCT